MLLLLALLLPATAPLADAQSAPSPPPRQTVWTVMNTVEAVVQDNYAIVKVIADIGNRGPDPEFPFQVRVPDACFVSGLTIVRDGKVHEARIEDRDAARQEYEEQKAAQETGGLVEKRRGASVYAFLINVAEFTSVRATLTYECTLAAVEGVFELPLEAPVSGFGQDLGARFDVLVTHRDGVSSAWGEPAGSASREGQGWRIQHAVGPRGTDEATPFAAKYTLPATADAGSLVAVARDGQGYFAHRFRAPADARELPLDLVLVLDTSGSMGGLKLQQMQDAASQVINLLREGDRLHLVLFSSSATSPWRGLRDASPEVRRQAGDEIRTSLAAGGTNIEEAIRRGFEGFDGIDWEREEGRMPLLVFLTDGQPSGGTSDRGELRRQAKEANAHGVNVFALAFGGDADWSLVAGLAADGQGLALRVPEGQGAEVDLRRFMGALTTPVLKNVTIAYGEGVQAHRRSAPILFAGSELLVIGTFDPALQRIEATVRAQGPDGPRAYNVSVPLADAEAAGWLPRLVAYQEIRRHQELIAAEGERAEWVQGIKALALKHGFVTDYTSLVVSLEHRDPQRGGCWEVCALESARGEAAMDSTAPGAPAPMRSPGSASGQPTGPADARLQEQRGGPGDARTPGFEAALALAGVLGAVLLARRKR